jgi:dienelactone hydrolase
MAILTAALAAGALGPLGIPTAAAAATSAVFAGHTVSGQAVPCVAQSDGTRVCHGDFSSSGGADLRLKSFDGTPLAFYVTLPAKPASGTDGSYPLIALSHGWDEPTSGPEDTQYFGPTADRWARDGYAVLQLVARGFGDSCGSAASRMADPAGCADGFIRLDDERYEARDVQYAIGLLVDEGIADPNRIGVSGESYGGGVSLELATLNDRVMNADGSLSPWRSPDGTPLHIAAAAPVIPWSDLVYSLLPNGRTLDTQITSKTADLQPLGIEKLSFVSGLFAEGQAGGYYSPPGVDEQADLPAWYASINAGEPYNTPEDQSIATQIAQFHSPYYLLDGAYGTAQAPPAPLLIANGFTDDLFPVDEAVRYYNLEHALYPHDPIALLDGDFGHMRAQNKPGDKALVKSAIEAFFDHYVKGAAPQPPLGATATIETCPGSVPSGGPYHASSFAALAPGVVSYSSNPAQTVLSSGGDPAASKAFDPVAGGGACASASASDQGSGVATYRLPAATGEGYTLLGAPLITARLSATGSFPQLDAWLLDVNPKTGTETLVARGLYRLDPSNPDGVQTFQLHPGAWHFAAGHIPELELLGQDPPYARPSNGSFQITVSNLQLTLPVHEAPGAPGTPPVVESARCLARPHSRIARRHVRAGRHRLYVSGTAGPGRCRHASAGARAGARVARVYVVVSRRAANRRCRFLQRNGLLTRARSCSRPVLLRARGTRRWSLRLRFHRHAIPPGRYLIRSIAVAADGRRQRPSRAATASVRIR